MDSAIEVSVPPKRPSGVWFVTIAYGLVFLLLTIVATMIMLTWSRLPVSAKMPLQQVSIQIWVRAAISLLVTAYAVIQLFRLKAVAVLSWGVSVAMTVVAICISAMARHAIGYSVIWLLLEGLVFWYAWDLRANGTLR